uniref:UDENN domain-containing protein n=1 Tax=Ditylenchus dipsaci TaxID=166011 RepID=A0A915ECR3_9BILA
MQPDSDFLYGFVHFRQQKNSSLPRGYYQKSIVLLTPLPLFGLFAHVVHEIALGFFESGENAIESACQQIDRWPLPLPGESLALPFIFLNVNFSLILSLCQVFHLQQFCQPFMRPTFIQARKCHYTYPIALGNCFVGRATSCNGVYPCSLFSTSSPTPPKIIIGVTNPFFSKAFKHWPHILRAGETPSLGTDGAHTPSSVERMLKKMANGKKMDSKPGFYSQYKPFLSYDKSLLKKLLKTTLSGVNQSFMIPLERYISTQYLKQAVPDGRIPGYPSANRSSANLWYQRRLDGNFYRKFICSSPNFQGWLAQRLKDVNLQLKATHLEVLCTADLSSAGLSSRQQVEIVDLVLKLKDRLTDLDIQDHENETWSNSSSTI